ncbi:MAG: LysE family translocator [Pseudomonadota bacterium]
MEFPVDPSRYIAFLSAFSALAAAPGPANLFALATGLKKGRGALFWSITGITVATFIWYTAAALGLATLTQTYHEIFSTLRYIGAVYLAWLGICALRADFSNTQPVKNVERSSLHQGFFVQITSPKVLLFFTAVLPAFLDMQRPLMAQLFIFGATSMGMDVISMTLYGLGGTTLSRHFQDARFRRVFALAVGILLMTAAALIIVER